MPNFKEKLEPKIPDIGKLWNLLSGNTITPNKENSKKVEVIIMSLRAHLLKLELEPVEYKEKRLVKYFWKLAQNLTRHIL